MKKGLVSVIVPVFNSEEFVLETLQSVASQTYTKFECLCIDDGSTDRSANIISEFSKSDPRFRLYRRPSNLQKGGNSCRNYGFEISNGEYIQWFDSDDLMKDTMLEQKVDNLTSNEDLNYVICETGYFSTASDVTGSYEQNLRSTNLYLDYLEFKTKFFTPGPMFRKAFLLDISLFNIKLKRHQEKEFFFRILLKDGNYGVIDEDLIQRRLHDSSLSVKIEAGKEKVSARFWADTLMLEAYKNAGLKDVDVRRWFRNRFLRYSYAFFKTYSLPMVARSGYCYLKALF